VIHQDVELRFVSDEVGYGVFATAPIPMGTITWTRCAFDRTMPPAQVAALAEPYARLVRRYAYVDGRGDSVLCWDHARYMNHSCAPTCLSPGFDFDVAVRDIGVGEELTCDYGMLNIDESFDCACGCDGCRKTIYPEDGHRLADAWDALLERAVHLVGKVRQPLWSLVREPARVTAAADGKSPVPSCRLHLRPLPEPLARQAAGARR
jgi:hypothetical protein